MRVTAAGLVRYRGHPTNFGFAEFISFDDACSHSNGALDKLIAFLLLPVIPYFKITDTGLVGGDRFEPIAA